MEVARERGIARGRDFDAAGVPRVYLQRLRDEGVLQQVGRGLYKLAGAEVATATSLAEATRLQPKGVVGLLSALQFHNLTTQNPHAVWMLLGPRDWAPTNPSVALRIVRASGDAQTAGIETHVIDGVPVRITSPEKTVADCFKYRNKIGLDVAIEALRDLMKSRTSRSNLDELWRYAEIDRVQRVIRPYIEAIIG
ncbi:type IV toxin-antitoxin system AbiEi family antitoxin domain-containing protein [Thauera sinica]|uniref:Type IV toxin-antitoxin system AbiEi family antitoxin domain-containing protein n=1 Tax=Thauera sinica TaxID=2665146 RepID=A0ABW1APL3_9RHOO|nr:type IV toxin-antitoxin system AbiEi family antitoxin domain-containing protein [Thauera sp. K11]